MKKKILVFNASSGISGDMTAAALIDLGADQKKLLDTLDSLHLEGAKVVISRVKKSALDACDFDVVLDEEHENHDHDMAYLHPEGGASLTMDHDHEHHHDHDHEHCDHDHHHDHDHEHCDHDHHHDHDHEYCDHDHHHDHDHDHGHGHHHHHHGRNLEDIRKILSGGSLTPRALELALKIFDIVAQAESAVHGEPLERVHFHEVGAVDSIIDIASVAICIDDLGITDVIVTDLSEGTGTVMCQHGLLPIPVPATAQILSSHGIAFRILGKVRGELITPTGAAVVAALTGDAKLPPSFRILKTGLGAGKRDYATAGVLRAMLIEPDEEIPSEEMSPKMQTKMQPCGAVQSYGDAQPHADMQRDEVIKLESNIDDSTAEALGFTMEKLMGAGALDVWYTPAYMKKHRPAYVLNVLCRPDDRSKMEEIIFLNTSTIGIRAARYERTKLERKIISVSTQWGNADVKCCSVGENTVYYPEADCVKRLSEESGIGYLEMYHKIKCLAEQKDA